MAIQMTGKNLTVEKILKVARGREKIVISPDAMRKIEKCREIVDRKVKERAVMYGVTTGIGELSEVVLTPEQVEKFQRYLVYSHAAGYGEPVEEDAVRAAILTRINVLCNGHSGIRLVIVETLVNMLNKGVTPIMCQKGSVGASGDLSPMAQMALVPIGEGEAIFEGKRMSGREAMDKAGIPIIRYEARDGLATINGSNVILGMGVLQIHDAERWIKTSEIACAMTLEVLNANMLAYDTRLHEVRGFPGAVECASNVRKIVEGSELLKQKGKKVQDAYSLRSSPQVIGAAKDALKHTRGAFEIEANGVGDNPLFFEDEGGICITGANFQGTPLALPLEYLGTSVTTVAALSERRMNRLMNPNLSMGLPAFLSKGAGMFAGLMLTQYTAGSLVCENRILCHPAATGSIPAAADQEDFVSMGMTTAIKTKQIIENADAVVAIELMAGAQAVDLRKPLKPGKGVKVAYDVIRKYVEFLDEDRPLFNDVNRLTSVVRSGEVLEEVEKAVGKLS
ncbi:aromatic amino acid lyase [candidate division TA06 bacterium]|uniref:Aromatic amino acid lyase n=1 Tax=candidate division TA06 bacterium TaxID=2250710 RepID=A0A523UYH6_UNCT6|nr:MAG: aromatic amino acid lyase [candidate division TA06 bacterium]